MNLELIQLGCLGLGSLLLVARAPLERRKGKLFAETVRLVAILLLLASLCLQVVAQVESQLGFVQRWAEMAHQAAGRPGGSDLSNDAHHEIGALLNDLKRQLAFDVVFLLAIGIALGSLLERFLRLRKAQG